MTTIPLASVKEALLAFAKNGGKCLITGEPGSGKDFVAKHAMGNRKVWCFLDDYGEDREGRWMVNIPDEIKREALIYVGIADNLYDILPTLVLPSAKLKVFFVNPDPSVFKRANLLKSETKKDVPDSWRKYWLAKSKFSDTAVVRYMRNELKNLVNRMTAIAAKNKFDIDFVEIANSRQGDPKAGWDQDTDQSTNAKEVAKEADVKDASKKEVGDE